jgi:arylsulfatase A-like enzyme
MGFTGKVPWLEKPNMDQLAKDGIYCRNTFVSTALSSPSRASILTGLDAHTHTVVDNSAPEPENIVYFPEYIQAAGYQTAFFGKWHMGSEGYVFYKTAQGRLQKYQLILIHLPVKLYLL